MVFVLFFLAVLILAVLWFWPSQSTRYRWSTALHAAWKLYWLPEEKCKAFLRSYHLFSKEGVTDVTSDGRLIVDYYSVINYLCSLGEVEKMYIPPVMDEKVGVFANQLLWEDAMYAAITKDRPPLKRILDLGCGRGRIAAHVSSMADSDCRVTGLNIDPTQIGLAREHAERIGAAHRLTFVQHDFNSLPLPFGDGEFDGMYQVQVLTYAADRVALFKELHRVLAPGARICFLDYVLLDKFDRNDPYQMQMLPKVKALLGAVADPSPSDYVSALEEAGFTVNLSQDASIGGHQSRLIRKADTFFVALKKLIEWGCFVRLFPPFFAVLFERLCRDCESFIEGDEKSLFTTSWQIVATKEPKDRNLRVPRPPSDLSVNESGK